MKDDAIAIKVQELVAQEAGISVDQVQLSSQLAEELDFDSLDTVSLVSTLNIDMGLALEVEELEDISTVDDLIKLVRSRS